MYNLKHTDIAFLFSCHGVLVLFVLYYRDENSFIFYVSIHIFISIYSQSYRLFLLTSFDGCGGYCSTVIFHSVVSVFIHLYTDCSVSLLQYNCSSFLYHLVNIQSDAKFIKVSVKRPCA